MHIFNALGLAVWSGVWSKRPKSETAQTKTAQVGYQNGPIILLHNYDRYGSAQEF